MTNGVDLVRVEFSIINLAMFFQMAAMKSANKELKGMMKTVNIQDVDVCILHYRFKFFCEASRSLISSFSICDYGCEVYPCCDTLMRKYRTYKMK